jgi:hypothetical protein
MDMQPNVPAAAGDDEAVPVVHHFFPDGFLIDIFSADISFGAISEGQVFLGIDFGVMLGIPCEDDFGPLDFGFF